MSDIGNRKIFAKNLSEFIRRSGKTRREISEETGIGYSTLSEWISGSKYPRIDKIELLANYFGVLKSDLIEEYSENASFPPQKTDNDIRRIERARANMDESQWQTVMRTLEAAFGQYFNDSYVDDDTDE